MLILFFIFILFSVALFHFLWTAIQPGQMLGFWQHALDWMYSHKMKMASKLLGACKVCFAHWIGVVSFILFVLFTRDMGYWVVKGWVNIVVYFAFVSISWFISTKTSEDGM